MVLSTMWQCPVSERPSPEIRRRLDDALAGDTRAPCCDGGGVGGAFGGGAM